MPPKKTKEPVRLRTKSLSNGNQSLYLDIYVNGVRRYEFLKMYLIPEKTKADKAANNETLRLAEAVKSLRVVDLQNNRYGFENKRGNILFSEYLGAIVREKKSKYDEDTWRMWECAAKWADKFMPKNAKIADITKDDCKRFCEMLITKTDLKVTSRHKYSSVIRTAFNRAVEEGHIMKSPFDTIEIEKEERAERVYLTREELTRMAKTPCTDDVVKRQFLFSCLTGLRWSDIYKLTWRDVYENDGKARIIFSQKKTGNLQYLDINAQAYSLMGERGEPGARVFQGFKYSGSVGKKLRRWAAAAGVDKHITFHSGRHTFAVMMIDLDVDIYTVQKLLGHTDIRTTEIYAEILDKRKVDAVNKIPDLL